MNDLPIPRRALAIAAHPDDVEFECGSTLAKWSANGCEVHHLICTDGSKGTWDEHADTVALVEIRKEEQREAALRLGATGEVHFLGEVDGELTADLSIRREVARVIRETRPTVVLGHDPWKRWRLHPDHRNAGFLAVEGVVAARDPFFFPELGLERHRPDTLLLFETEEPNHVEDVTGFTEPKVDALLAHESQFETTMVINDNPDAETAAFRDNELDQMRAMAADHPFEFGEAFHRIDDL
ncbi:MAG: PIG-L family deacetylase [Acidimicrobiales bacterium]|nr:PIG-L family deacetylase [Acidimicrobiia bacterium]NNC79020.1 PIG-L family deacetylase [Acidimicrobiales bacterium]RZV47191.1 MAG: PIG-L family deacetylase [Acidimicrobiales bacterium]